MLLMNIKDLFCMCCLSQFIFFKYPSLSFDVSMIKPACDILFFNLLDPRQN